MKKSVHILVSMLLTLSFVSCQREDPLVKAAKDYAVKQDIYGLYEKDKEVFLLDENIHQVAYNPTQRMYRIQTDNMSKLLQMTLDASPKVGALRVLSLKTRGLPSLESKYNVEVLKISEKDAKVWLLDPETLCIFIMYYEFE